MKGGIWLAQHAVIRHLWTTKGEMKLGQKYGYSKATRCSKPLGASESKPISAANYTSRQTEAIAVILVPRMADALGYQRGDAESGNSSS